jgi:uncharacterized protein
VHPGLRGSEATATAGNESVSVRLRGHHFLCILTYRGLGYSAPFIANMSRVVEAIGNGATIALDDGPDDICRGLTASCAAASGHDCQDPETRAMDAVALAAVSDVLGRNLSAPSRLSGDDITRLRQAFKDGAIRRACFACPWMATCTTIATEDFSGTHLVAAKASS